MTDRRALHATNDFVGRTMNWLYDHLRLVPRYDNAVLCHRLQNRDEFPDIPARELRARSLSRRLWRRVAGAQLFPSDWFWLKRFQPSVFHSHFGYVAVENVDLARSLGVPWFVSFYGADVYEMGRLEEWRTKYAPMFDTAARVLALGPVMAEALAAIGCPREKIRVHPLGVDANDLPLRARTRAVGEPLRVLFAGTFREKKGIRYLIEGVGLAANRGARIELDLVGDAAGKAGDSEVKAEVLQMARDLRLAAPVRHHTFVKFKELVDMAMNAHVFVAPSITGADGDSEGTPFVLQQMMSTGMACVSTVHADIPYLFGEHRGMLVPERDSTAIADWLMRYWERPELMTGHGTALARQIRTHFDARACAASLSGLYDEALADIPLTAAHPVST